MDMLGGLDKLCKDRDIVPGCLEIRGVDIQQYCAIALYYDRFFFCQGHSKIVSLKKWSVNWQVNML